SGRPGGVYGWALEGRLVTGRGNPTCAGGKGVNRRRDVVRSVRGSGAWLACWWRATASRPWSGPAASARLAGTVNVVARGGWDWVAGVAVIGVAVVEAVSRLGPRPGRSACS